MEFAGGCRCGAARYALEADALPAVYACHCLDCQKMSGSAFALQAPIREERLRVAGDLAEWVNEDPSGRRRVQRFCAICKTRLFSTNSTRPGIAVLRAGTLDLSNTLVPAAHIWTKRKQPWIALPEGTPAFEENAPVDRFLTIFASNFA